MSSSNISNLKEISSNSGFLKNLPSESKYNPFVFGSNVISLSSPYLNFPCATGKYTMVALIDSSEAILLILIYE